MRSVIEENGFTYVVLLVAILIMGIMAEVLVQSASIKKQREREQELLYTGEAYYHAIKAYYLSSSVRKYPKNIESLLMDNRFAYRRHLRQAYKDPLTGGEWKLIRNTRGGIVGVSSKSRDKPLKQDNFTPPFSHFSHSEHYSDWRFVYNPQSKNNGQNPH